MSAETRCLQCEQTPSEIRRHETICGIEEGYEYRELVHEWPRHRWASWNDKELARAGIRPEAYDKYRRTPATDLQWAGCDDNVRGHTLSTKTSELDDFGVRIGQCIACGRTPNQEAGA